MTRRCWLLSAIAAPLRGDDAGTRAAWDELAQAAAALGQGNAVRFLTAFDAGMPGFAALRADIQGLLAAWEVQASIELAAIREEAGSLLMELDWLLVVSSRAGDGRSRRTRTRVRCRLEWKDKRWRIAAFEPLAMFSPPRL